MIDRTYNLQVKLTFMDDYNLPPHQVIVDTLHSMIKFGTFLMNENIVDVEVMPVNFKPGPGMLKD
jgi:hypothetical protein